MFFITKLMNFIHYIKWCNSSTMIPVFALYSSLRNVQEKIDCTYTSSVQCQTTLIGALNTSTQVVLSKYQAAVLCANPCKNNPCANKGVCTPNGFGYQCACLSGFSGVRCELGLGVKWDFCFHILFSDDKTQCTSFINCNRGSIYSK